MGQSNARQRLKAIKENVDEIAQKIKADELSEEARSRSHEILVDYITELKLILSKSLRQSRIRKVEKLIIAALQELAILEGTWKNVEPRLKAKSMQTLHQIEQDIKSLNESLTNQNLKKDKETVRKYKKKITLIQDIDQEVDVRKSKVMDVVNSVENTFTELEAEELLKKVEEQHHLNKLDLGRFVGVSGSNCYKNHKEYLLNLKEEIKQIADVSPKIAERKRYLLYNIDNNIVALDRRVQENENNIKQRVGDGAFGDAPPTVNLKSVDDVVNSYSEFEKSFSANCPLDELQGVFRKLTHLKIKIDQKLNVLENQIQIQDYDPYIELVPVKESEVQDASDAPTVLPRVLHKIKNIQKAVEYLHQQMMISAFTKNGHSYKNWKKELENYKNELEILPIRNEKDQSCFNSVSNYIDDVLSFLDSHYTAGRRSSTGDILIDIMTASTVVNDLGSKIQTVGETQNFDFIENELLDNLYYLRKLEIPAARSNVCKFRDYIVIQIDSHLSKLEKIKKRRIAQFSETPEILGY